MAKQKKNIEFKLNKKSGNLPVKRTLNLASAGKKEKDLRIIIPVVVIIVIAAILFTKFAVIDRLQKLHDLQDQNAAIQAQIDAYNMKIAELEKVTGDYAHYTYSDMTDEEMNRPDRKEVLDMIDTYVLSAAQLKTWQLNENILTMQLSGITVDQVNAIISNLEKEPIVEHCLVSTAATKENESVVEASVTVYLNSARADEEETETAETSETATEEGGSAE